jgi:hypothetical protein
VVLGILIGRYLVKHSAEKNTIVRVIINVINKFATFLKEFFVPEK